MLSVLRDYGIKGEVSADEAWKWKRKGQRSTTSGVDGDGPGGTLSSQSESESEGHSMLPMSDSVMVSDGHVHGSSFRIGRVLSIVVGSSRSSSQCRCETSFTFLLGIQLLLSSNGGNGILPTSVRRIRFRLPFHPPLLALTLPDHVTHINIEEFDESFRTEPAAAAGAAASSAAMNTSFKQWKLPSSLQSLTLGDGDGWPWSRSLTQLNLPSTLTQLHLGAWNGRADQLPTLPPNLQTFNMGSKFNDRIDSIQWHTVTHSQP